MCNHLEDQHTIKNQHQSQQKLVDNDERCPVENLEPHDQPVDSAMLLDEMSALLGKYVYLPEGMIHTISAWCLGSYCFSSWQLYPKLLITSPEKRCGKTTLLEVIEGMAFRCYPVSSISSSAIFRLIEEYKPTLLIDEADTFTKDDDSLNGIINAGHKKRLANVSRTERDGNEFHVRSFSVWAPMVLSGIGKQRDTLHDRSIHIEMERKLPDYSVEKLPFNFFETKQHLRQKCMRWANDRHANLRMLASLPNYGNDRAQDNWQPLITIASHAGESWKKRLLNSYQTLMLADIPEEDAGILLLRDIQTILTEGRHGRLASGLLVEKLIAIEDSPWCEWKRGNPMTQNSLSRLLKPFKIKAKQLRIGSKNLHGFEAKQFKNAFIRYIPPIQTATTLQTSCSKGCSGFQSTTKKENVALQKGLKSSYDKACSTVALQKGEIETTV